MLLGQVAAGALAAEEQQVGVLEDELEELAVFVREALEDFLLLVASLAALLDHVRDDGQGQADDGDAVGEEFGDFEGSHAGD